MADLLSHVLVAYALLTVTGWRLDTVSRQWVVVAMGGAAIPDLSKVGIVVPSHAVSNAVGVPFSYGPVSTLGGVVVLAAIIAVLFGRDRRRRAFTFLLVGGVTSLLVDALRLSIDGRASAVLYPLSWWRPPSPNLYLTSDPRVLGVAIVLAAVVFALDRRVAT